MTVMKRREMLHNALIGAVSSAAFSSIPFKMAMAQEMAAQGPMLRGAGSNYKALVCLYLYGGNDSFNTVVPRDASYTQYQTMRTNLAVPQANLLALNPTQGPVNGGQYGLHPSMTGVKEMFDAGQCAIIANVGTLVRPVTKTAYQNGSVAVPPQLFSHSDQSVFWQTPSADTANRIGWGGRLADIFRGSNTNQTLSMNVSLNGDNVFQAGNNVAPYFMNSYGVEQIEGIQTDTPADCGPTGHWRRRSCLSFKSLMTMSEQPGRHPFETAYVDKTKRSIDTAAQVRAAIAPFPANDLRFRAFWDAFGLAWSPNSNSLPELPEMARQLLMVARVITARTALNMSRQLFFAGIGGFDTHDNQLVDHPERLRDLSQSVKAFYQVIGALGLTNDVTAFTASDFGRTMSNNGDGTDHGWGSHQFVFGGNVLGNRIYGKMPSYAPSASNPEDAGWGQIIPTLSADQYAATIARWYGVPDTGTAGQIIPDIFPNLQYMTTSTMSIPGSNLGFMQVV